MSFLLLSIQSSFPISMLLLQTAGKVVYGPNDKIVTGKQTSPPPPPSLSFHGFLLMVGQNGVAESRERMASQEPSRGIKRLVHRVMDSQTGRCVRRRGLGQGCCGCGPFPSSWARALRGFCLQKDDVLLCFPIKAFPLRARYLHLFSCK